MGMRANYQYLSDEEFMELKKMDEECKNGKEEEFFEKVEEWNEEARILLDIDKMWDVLHFVLTGVSAGDPIEEDLLSEAVVGVVSLEDMDEFIAYIQKERVADILSALEQFDIEEAMREFSMQKCKAADLYPDIWDYDDDEAVEELTEEIIDCFQQMKVFYQKILEANGNVLVTIY